MRNAVTHTYNASRALVRVAAVQANKYTITNNNNNNNKILHITYSKMTQGRGEYEEDVDYIPLDALQQVITAIHMSDPESLRPITLAQLSPRVFWSLLLHHQHQHHQGEESALSLSSSGDGSNTTTTNYNIEQAYMTLLPNLPWTFLKKRKLTLSDKAKENLRQQQQELDMTDTESNNNNNNNMQAAQDAIQAVEDAMDSLHSYNADQRRNNAAQAALARANMMTTTPATTTTTTQQPLSWELVTPTEVDKDELIACIENDYSNNNDNTTITVDQLLQLHINNWRMLANCTSSHLSERMQIPEMTIDLWLDHAQQESIDEIMVEICDGNVDAVEALREEAKSGTPKDMANWRMIPDMLLAATPSLVNAVSVPTVAEWCRRSHELLQQYSWMNWYATPVE
jgi:hypothetical protein